MKGVGEQTTAPFKLGGGSGGIYQLSWQVSGTVSSQASGPGNCDYEATLYPEAIPLFSAHTSATTVSLLKGESQAGPGVKDGDHYMRMITGPSCAWEITLRA